MKKIEPWQAHLKAAEIVERRREKARVAHYRWNQRKNFAYELVRRLGLMHIVDEAERTGVISVDPLE